MIAWTEYMNEAIEAAQGEADTDILLTEEESKLLSGKDEESAELDLENDSVFGVLLYELLQVVTSLNSVWPDFDY